MPVGSLIAVLVLTAVAVATVLGADRSGELEFGTYPPPTPPISEPLVPPPSSDARSIRGVYWLARAELLLPGIKGEMPPFNDAGRALFWSRANALLDGQIRPGDPPVMCRPWGTVHALNSPFQAQFIQTPGQITMLIEEDHLVRRIYLNRTHPKDLRLTYMGDSIAHWDHNTLMVDTVGFKDQGWMDEYGSPSSTKLHVTEKIRKIEKGEQLEDVITVDDPTYYTKPFSFRQVYQWRPDVSWDEIICEENNRDMTRQSTPQNGATP
jgi:hypothetical protein